MVLGVVVGEGVVGCVGGSGVWGKLVLIFFIFLLIYFFLVFLGKCYFFYLF